MTIQTPQWIAGSSPGKAANVHFLVAIQYPTGLVYDVLPWAFEPPGDYFWRGLDSAAAKVVGYMELTRAIEWATGVGSQQDILSAGNVDKLVWKTGEPEDKSQGYVVSLPSHYNLLTWIEDGDDSEWLFPTREELDTGYDRYISLPEFLRYIAKNLKFSV
ncbi:hypothetical protein BTA51_20030 [Hahella sp. CCB-MM4]|uniref:hypothetical protein n=1 Tax=Hahella sp. (strain CCB-MM4) TaxID=1926491 RepID=UPI000B9B6B8E|nr:hypothetical protein [Hahella sp. CCB-MM4]OZG71573.1 hypothetical protein BTA51_20030 [Hahella sp. CCB-MM4]